MCIAMLAGCSQGKTSYQTKTYTADGTQVTDIQIDVTDRLIEIEPSADDQISITYAESDKEFYRIDIVDGNTLVMTGETNKAWTDYIGGNASRSDRTIHLQLPAALLSNLEITTTNEDVTISELTVTGSISIQVNSGSITFAKLAVGAALRLEAKNGDIRGTVMGGYDDFSISSEAKKGDNNLPAQKEGGEKTLDVFTNNGDIEIALEKS